MEFTIPFLNLTGDGTVCRCSSCQYLHIAPHFAVPLQVSNESGEALAQVKDRIVSAMPGKLRQKLESQGETGKLCCWTASSLRCFSVKSRTGQLRASVKPFRYLGHNKLLSASSVEAYLGWQWYLQLEWDIQRHCRLLPLLEVGKLMPTVWKWLFHSGRASIQIKLPKSLANGSGVICFFRIFRAAGWWSLCSAGFLKLLVVLTQDPFCADQPRILGHPLPLWMWYLGRMALCIFSLLSWTLSWSMDCWEIAWAWRHLLLLECWLTVHSWKKKQESEFNSIQWQFIVGAFPLYLCQWNFEKWLKFHVARKRGLLSVTNAWIHFLKLVLFAVVPLLLFCYIGSFCCLPVLNSLSLSLDCCSHIIPTAFLLWEFSPCCRMVSLASRAGLSSPLCSLGVESTMRALHFCMTGLKIGLFPTAFSATQYLTKHFFFVVLSH